MYNVKFKNNVNNGTLTLLFIGYAWLFFGQNLDVCIHNVIHIVVGLMLFLLRFGKHYCTWLIYIPIQSLFVTLLENRFLTLVIKDFQHWLLTDVNTTDIKSLNINIGFLKSMSYHIKNNKNKIK